MPKQNTRGIVLRCKNPIRCVLALVACVFTPVKAICQEAPEPEHGTYAERYEPFVLKRDALPIGEHAYFFLPPKSPVAGRITYLTWAPTGRYCIAEVVVGEDQLFKRDLVQAANEDRTESKRAVWLDLMTGTSAVMLEIRSGFEIAPLGWSVDGSTVYLEECGEDYKPVALQTFRNGVHVRSHKVPEMTDRVAVDPSTGEIALLMEVEEKSTEPRLFLVDQSSRSHAIRDVNGQAVKFIDVSTGTDCAMAYWLIGPEAEGEVMRGRIDFRSLKIVNPKKFSYMEDEPVSGQLDFFHRELSGTFGLAVSERRTEERPNPPSLLISSEVEDFWESPANNAIAYSSQGILVIKEIVKTTRATYNEFLVLVNRNEKMDACKQIALAFLMYAGDSDDILPTSQWQEAIRPYLKNDPLMDGFVYTFNGGDLASIERPAATELGYLPLDGGRIVAYVDGHVEWKPNK